jgi:uncharacterized damage-inducible protein DinB
VVARTIGSSWHSETEERDVVSGADLLADGFDRIHDVVHRAVDGLSTEQLRFRPAGEANSMAWLAWHLSRVQDDHVADAARREQVWLSGGWCERFALPFERQATGYGQSADEVAALRVRSPELLLDYLDAVHEQTIDYVRDLTDKNLDRIVDDSWDPPVTLAVRLVSVISDDLQHAGQLAYVRGLLPR